MPAQARLVFKRKYPKCPNMCDKNPERWRCWGGQAAFLAPASAPATGRAGNLPPASQNVFSIVSLSSSSSLWILSSWTSTETVPRAAAICNAPTATFNYFWMFKACLRPYLHSLKGVFFPSRAIKAYELTRGNRAAVKMSHINCFIAYMGSAS